MELRRGLRDWLLAKDSDPSVRLRVLRDILDRPTDDPAVARAQKEVGRRGWAAQILNGQHTEGHWVTPGNSARELYRPKYVATNWRLLVLSDIGLTKKNARVARAVNLFVRRFSRTGDLGGPRSEVCFTGNAVRMLVRLDVPTSLGRVDDPRIRPSLDRLIEMRNRDGSWNMDALHPDSEDPAYQFRGPFYPLGLEVAGRPSRWITTTALTVLKRMGEG